MNSLKEVVDLFMQDSDEKALKELYKITNDDIVKILIDWKKEYSIELQLSNTHLSNMYEDVMSYVWEKYKLNEIVKEDFEDSVEETITKISNLDNEKCFTVARVMEDGKCVELHYNEGEAYLEYGIKMAEDMWENQTKEDISWFNLNLTDDEVLIYLNREFECYFEGKEMEIDL